MATETQTQKSIIDELNNNLHTGFTKSVNALFDDIIDYLKHRTADGFRVSQYNKKWTGLGTMLSPVYIGYEGLGHNSVMGSNDDLNKLFDAVYDKLKAEQIIVSEWEFEYKTSNNVNYFLSIRFNLEVPPVEKPSEKTMNSPSHSPENNEFDFKCGSC